MLEVFWFPLNGQTHQTDLEVIPGWSLLVVLLNVDQYLIKNFSELQILKWQSYSIIAEAFFHNFNFEIPLEIEKDIVMEN